MEDIGINCVEPFDSVCCNYEEGERDEGSNMENEAEDCSELA
jgi:hypothetical protein